METSNALITETKKVANSSTEYIISGTKEAVRERLAEIGRAWPVEGYGTSGKVLEEDATTMKVRVWHSNSCD